MLTVYVVNFIKIGFEIKIYFFQITLIILSLDSSFVVLYIINIIFVTKYLTIINVTKLYLMPY